MFFCPNCNNSLDITKTLSGNNQTGGKKGKKNTDDNNISDQTDPTDPTDQTEINDDNILNTDTDNYNGQHNLQLIDDNKKVYFECNNCGYFTEMQPGTKIFSRTSSEISQTVGYSNYEAMLNSSILPRTRNYKCPNNNCESHKDASKREAVFFRLNNTYKIKYVCSACKTDF
jgi:hypothetical protein